jgi:hypothetical protein
LISESEGKHTDHIHVIKHATLHTVTHAHFYQALTVNSATIKCEQQYKHKSVRYRNMTKSIETKFHWNRSCLSEHIMDTVRTKHYAILYLHILMMLKKSTRKGCGTNRHNILHYKTRTSPSFTLAFTMDMIAHRATRRTRSTTSDFVLNAIYMTKPANNHVKVTSFFFPLYTVT